MNNSCSLEGLSVNDFKNALNNYTTTIKKAKSKESLTNYQSKYREYLKRRVSTSLEKRCKKVSNFIDQDHNTEIDYKYFPFLYKNRHLKLQIKVPTTLYISKNLRFLVMFKDYLNFATGPEATQKFIDSIVTNEGFPICVFNSFGRGIMFFSDIESVIEFINDNENLEGYFQHFIKPCAKNPGILLTNSKKNGFNKHYLLHKNLEVEKSRPVKEIQIQNPLICYLQKIMTNATSIPKYKDDENASLTNDSSIISVIEEKKGIKSTSFFKGLVKNVNNYRQSRPICINTQEKYKKYIISSNDFKNLSYYSMKTYLPDVEKMTCILFTMLFKEYKVKYNKDVDEIQLIYIKDQNQGWLLLKVKAIKCLQAFSRKTPSKFSLSEENSPLFFKKSMMKLDLARVVSPMCNVVPDLDEIPHSRIHIRSLNKIKAKCAIRMVDKDDSIKECKDNQDGSGGLNFGMVTEKFKIKHVFK